MTFEVVGKLSLNLGSFSMVREESNAPSSPVGSKRLLKIDARLQMKVQAVQACSSRIVVVSCFYGSFNWNSIISGSW